MKTFHIILLCDKMLITALPMVCPYNEYINSDFIHSDSLLWDELK